MVPFLKLLYREKFKKVSETLDKISTRVTEKYHDHLNDYQPGLIRDFCDGLIEAKEEAIKDDKESAPYFTDNNLALVILDLFFGYFSLQFNC
jgi:hypothetical protein